MSQTGTYRPAVQPHEQAFHPSIATIGFEKAQRLLLIGCGCLLVVFIFGVILCRLDISAGKRRRAQQFQPVEH